MILIPLLTLLTGARPLTVEAAVPVVIAAGDWSKAAADRLGNAVRGRLVLAEKVVSPERREVAVYVELQDARESIGSSLQLYCEMGPNDFRPEFKRGLHCEMRSADGKLIEPTGFPFSGGVPANEWLTLPSDGTIRVRATPFGIWRPGAIAVCPSLGGMWNINDGDTKEYRFSGRFTVDPPADLKVPGEGHVWRGTIELPAVKLRGQGQGRGAGAGARGDRRKTQDERRRISHSRAAY